MPTHQILYGFAWQDLTGLAQPAEAGLGQAVAKGYRVIEASAECWADSTFAGAVARRGLLPVVQCSVAKPEDLQPALRLARQTGALTVNARAGNPDMDSHESANFVNVLYDLAVAAGVRLVLETRHGCVTQDLDATARLVTQVPRLALCLDVTQYIEPSEQMSATSDLRSRLDPLLDRTHLIHCRVTVGRPMQDATDEKSHDSFRFFAATWTEAMRRWRRKAPPGSAFLFITQIDPTDRDLVDRWQQFEAVRVLGAEAWASSAKSAIC